MNQVVFVSTWCVWSKKDPNARHRGRQVRGKGESKKNLSNTKTQIHRFNNEWRKNTDNTKTGSWKETEPDLYCRRTLISNLPSFKSTLHRYLLQSLLWFWFASILICCWCCFILQITSGNNRVMLYLSICWFELCVCRRISYLFQFIPRGRFFQSVSSPIWMSDTPQRRPPHPYFMLHYIKHLLSPKLGLNVNLNSTELFNIVAIPRDTGAHFTQAIIRF